MKKLLALLLALCMIFAFTACSQSEKEKQINQAIEKIEDAADELDSALDSGDLDVAVDALDDYASQVEDAGATTNMKAKDVVDAMIADPSHQTQVDSFKAQGLLYSLEARDNYVAYVYQYNVVVPNLDQVKTSLDATIDALESAADALFQICTGIDGVIFEYKDISGNIIASYTFDK